MQAFKVFIYLFVLFCSFFSLLIYPKKVFAARAISITSSKASLYGDEEMVINASPSGFTTGETIYVKGAFYQDGGTNYFGYTKNGDNLIKNGDSTVNQRQVKIGEWDGFLVSKSDFLDSGYKGEGSYKYKVGFYYTTSGGNLSLVWSSNVLDINLNEPDPTPTQTPTPTSTPTPTPTNTPTPTPTKKPATITPLNSPTVSANALDDSTSSAVLGESSDSASINDIREQNTLPSDVKIMSEKGEKLPLVLMAVGGVFLVFCAILWFWLNKKRIIIPQD